MQYKTGGLDCKDRASFVSGNLFPTAKEGEGGSRPITPPLERVPFKRGNLLNVLNAQPSETDNPEKRPMVF